MTDILDTAVAFFQAEDWPATPIEGQSLLRLSFQGDNGQWLCYGQAREEQQQWIFYSVCPVRVPEGRRLAVAEFVTRANYGLLIGNFELDMNDGEIRYKTSLDVTGDRLTVALVQQTVYANVLMMDRYLPGLMAVIYGGAAAEQAVAEVEGSA